MNSDDDFSSNEGTRVGEESKTKVNLTQENVKELISSLLLSVVEYLTKICVICEGDDVADAQSVKNLMKYMYCALKILPFRYKFEKTLKKLQKIIEYSNNQSYDLGIVIKGLVKAVDEYANPYEWLYDNVVDKYLKSGEKLDESLSIIDTLQTNLLERLQVSKIDEAKAEPQVLKESTTRMD
ncbi:conserved hypothetical protein [Theileria orientalis strain Shintoku]|uniref:Uncharacterized protein n=1 Tax=Theileria orientalis strain Shintoku TaxID=869250 RepID=J4C7C8_THEOR|nr:conserved hypothetical protein [Theileria orientalis strain Shintoku]PVC52297.1 hypothetical protein MACL_00000869 [Theileria orientalis]BAM38813.1 conserved hypothetical protein [Theileria orientalis strain Shintoku]|eukprot:XP_009689114.1 conserved hypothetical protein [Theileria orientalis strain Shintoku]